MPLYKYKAKDKQGFSKDGLTEAESPQALTVSLKKLGYTVMAVKEQTGVDVSISEFIDKIKGISRQDVILFIRQLSVMLGAGISLINSLDSIREHIQNRKLKEILSEVKEDIKGGQSFSNSLKKHPKVFPDLFVNMVVAGEASGKLAEVLVMVAQLGIQEIELRTKVKAAFTYPIILVVVSVGIVTAMLVGVLPKFVGIFESTGVKLPMSTVILLGISDFLRRFKYLILVVGIAGGWGVKQCLKTEKGKYKFDRAFLRLPVLGSLLLKATVCRFTRNLSLLTKTGVPILHALEVSASTVDNSEIRKGLNDVQGSLTSGEGLAQSLRVSGIFPSMVVQMISAGESTGELDKMLNEIANFYDLEVSQATKNLTAILEPLLLVVMGGIVGFIALSVLLPMFNMVKAFR